jgi:hypothetical protein
VLQKVILNVQQFEHTDPTKQTASSNLNIEQRTATPNSSTPIFCLKSIVPTSFFVLRSTTANFQTHQDTKHAKISLGHCQKLPLAQKIQTATTHNQHGGGPCVPKKNNYLNQSRKHCQRNHDFRHCRFKNSPTTSGLQAIGPRPTV